MRTAGGGFEITLENKLKTARIVNITSLVGATVGVVVMAVGFYVSNDPDPDTMITGAIIGGVGGGLASAGLGVSMYMWPRQRRLKLALEHMRR